jgi:hypothetical protein
MMFAQALVAALYFTVLAWMQSLAPGREVESLAWAVAVTATSETEAAVFTAVAFRESSLINGVTGDGGHSVCAMQIYDGPKSLLEDPIACIERGARMLRESRRMDPKNPIAFYARGPKYKSEEAQRISRDRMALAARLVRSTRDVPPVGDVTSAR